MIVSLGATNMATVIELCCRPITPYHVAAKNEKRDILGSEQSPPYERLSRRTRPVDQFNRV